MVDRATLYSNMDIYRHPTFDMACAQFDRVANLLEIDPNDRDRL